MYALHGHQFSRVFGRYGMAILAFVLIAASCVHSANGQTSQANYGSVRASQTNDQIYFAGTDNDVSVESVLSQSNTPPRSNAPLADPIAEGTIESRSVQDSPTESLYDAMVFSFSGGGTCDSTGCNSTTACSICGQHACGNCRSWELFQNCTPPGMLQWMKARHDHGNACWTGRTEAVMLWRSAPYSRELVITGPGPVGSSILNANQLESGMAAGPRIQLFRKDACGSAIEFGYLGAWSFQSEKLLPDTGALSAYAASDLIGASTSFETGTANLTSSIQTIEVNSRTPMAAGNVQFICGVRWLEWTESFSLDTTTGPINTDDWSSRTVNNLYGGQIGIDALLYSNRWLHVESVLKGGAYWNEALSRQIYQQNGAGVEISGYDSPSPAAFVGELGFTGVMPLTSNLNFRFGYLVFWLQGIAQPTRQLSLPVSTTGDPLVLQNGGTVVQGLTLGLEGRW